MRLYYQISLKSPPLTLEAGSDPGLSELTKCYCISFKVLYIATKYSESKCIGQVRRYGDIYN